MIISKTPVRISLLGGGTDYPEYFLEHTGCVITTTIDKYCYVGVGGGQVWVHSELPSGCGMGTSSAATVGLLKATTQKSNEEVALLATHLERDKTGGGCGYQDQYICAMGGFKRLRFYGSGIVAEDLGWGWLESYLMLFDTGIYRKGGQIIKHQLERIEHNKSTLHQLKKLALDDYDTYEELGNALHTAWVLKRDLSDDTSTHLIDQYYKIAIEAGAIGGKLLGGGGGGFMIFVVPHGKEAGVRSALMLKQIEFKFVTKGTEIIFKDNI